MEEALYKSIKTKRGYTYQYYHSKPEATGTKPTIVFLHGFPHAGTDWIYQVVFFRNLGFGIIVPDMLGYGGTDKPQDPKEYRWKLMSNDIADILDEEKLDKVIGIAHDWGSAVLGRLAVYHPERFLAFAFFAVGYMAPAPSVDPDKIMGINRKLFGETIIGYQVFLAENRAAKLIEEHMDSFISACFGEGRPKDFLRTTFSPVGALEDWLLADKMAPGELSPERQADVKHRSEVFLKNGMTGPTNWYKVFLRNLNAIDEAELTVEKATITHPVFYCGGTKDLTCLPQIYVKIHEKFCPNTTYFVLEAGHSVHITQHDLVNAELHKWISSFYDDSISDVKSRL